MTEQYVRNGSPRCVSVFYQGEHMYLRATASASFISFSELGPHWWVDRVFVYTDLRGSGLGKRLVLDMLELIKEQGGGRVIVAPGGYNTPYEEQEAFYRACGFNLVERGLLDLNV